MKHFSFFSVLLALYSVGGIAQVQADEVHLDLRAVANRAFIDKVAEGEKVGWTHQGPDNSLKHLKSGLYQFTGTGYEIIQGTANGGKEALVFDSTYENANLHTVEIPMGENAPTNGGVLYLLHTGCWVPAKGNQKIATVSVRFASGKVVDFPVLNNHELGDWWAPIDQENGAVAYREENGSKEVGIYASKFVLPSGNGRPISIRLATEGGPIWIVIAVTLSEVNHPWPKHENWQVQSGDEWKPLNPPSGSSVKAGSALDFSHLFGEPQEAGSDGFAMINAKGELVFEKNPDVPLRLLCASEGMMPGFTCSPEETERFAEQIARAGYNAFRPHFLDTMLMMGSKEDGVFNPVQLDRWDRLSAALKRRGIYLYMDAMSSWAGYYAVAETFSQKNKELKMRSRLYYDETARANWQKGVKRLFEHVNPYTGVALKDEPQVVIVELRNEAGLNFLMHLPDSRDPGIVMPFRAWLKKRYGTTGQLKAAWSRQEGDARVSYLRSGQTLDTVALPALDGSGPDTRDLQGFFVDIERETYQWLAQAIRAMGVKVPLLDFNVGSSVETTLARDVLAVVDSHSYHDHPQNLDSQSTISGGSSLANGAGYVRALAGARQWGAPFLCSEWGHVSPNPWRYEAGLTAPVYAALQGWQMLTQHANPVSPSPMTTIKPFSISADTPLKAADYMAVLLFRRGDVRTSPHRIEVKIDPGVLGGHFPLQDSLPSSITRLGLLAGLGVQVAPRPGAAPRGRYQADWSLLPDAGDQVMTQQGAQVVQEHSLAADPTLTALVDTLRRKGILGPDNHTDVRQGIYESDTGQIRLDEKTRTIEVVTPRSEGATLTAEAPHVALGVLEAKNLSGNAAIFVASLTDAPLAKSNHLLLIVATDALNTGMTFSDIQRHKRLDAGTAPVLMRVARIELRLKHEHPESLKLWALGAGGERAEEIPLTIKDGGIEALLDTGKFAGGPTPYFEITSLPTP